MKYSMSSRQTAEYLKKVDEIKVQWRDRNIIPDLFEKYPDATVNLVRYFQDSESEIDWKQLEDFNILGRGKFILGLTLTNEMIEADKREFKFHYLAALRTFQELRDVINFGVCRVRLGSPLFFQMDKVKKICEGRVEICAIANLASNDSLFERPNGVTGIWIRPEDVELYEPYVDVIEFIGQHKQEQALYRIYAEGHGWSGDLADIVQDLNYPGVNRMLTDDLTKARLNCGQRCQENGICHLCYRSLDLADPDKWKQYFEVMKQD